MIAILKKKKIICLITAVTFMFSISASTMAAPTVLSQLPIAQSDLSGNSQIEAGGFTLNVTDEKTLVVTSPDGEVTQVDMANPVTGILTALSIVPTADAFTCVMWFIIAWYVVPWPIGLLMLSYLPSYCGW